MTDRLRVYRWASITLLGSLALFSTATLSALGFWVFGPTPAAVEASTWVMLGTLPLLFGAMAVGTWNDHAARAGR